MLRLLVLLFVFAFSATAVDTPAQAARGKAIFFDAVKTTKCATCHQLEGKGTAIGPDLTRIARIHPKAIALSVRATRTVYAKEVELKAKHKFPAIITAENQDEVRMFDLSKVPPDLLTVKRSAIYSIRDNGTWKHPPESSGYTDEEVADVIAFIRFVAYGDTKGVDPAELK